MNYQFISAYLDPLNGFAIVRFSLQHDGSFVVYKTHEVNYVPTFSAIQEKITEFAEVENPQQDSLTILSNFPASLKQYLVNHLGSFRFYIRSTEIDLAEAVLLLQHILKGFRITILENEKLAINKALSLSKLVLRGDETKPLLLMAILNGIGWVESKLIALNDEVG